MVERGIGEGGIRIIGDCTAQLDGRPSKREVGRESDVVAYTAE